MIGVDENLISPRAIVGSMEYFLKPPLRNSRRVRISKHLAWLFKISFFNNLIPSKYIHESSTVFVLVGASCELRLLP